MPQVTVWYVYVLWLNSVYGRCEDRTPVAWSDDLERLQAWERSQYADTSYLDGIMRLRYKPDSPLKWFNPSEPVGSLFEPPHCVAPSITEAVVDSLDIIPASILRV